MKISSAQEMFDLGKIIGAQLRAGDLILLNGPLGAVKTLLVQGIGAALGHKRAPDGLSWGMGLNGPCHSHGQKDGDGSGCTLVGRFG